jgi:hypothetical protein
MDRGQTEFFLHSPLVNDPGQVRDNGAATNDRSGQTKAGVRYLFADSPKELGDDCFQCGVSGTRKGCFGQRFSQPFR